jgi:tRNA/rRNA methyltransferase
MIQLVLSPPQVRIILVEPRGALNVGMVARSMANFGLKDLVLVNPQGEAADYQGEEVRALFHWSAWPFG